MNIALMAHDTKKEMMIQLCIAYKKILGNHQLYATAKTGKLVADATDLKVKRFLSGPLGGDQQIGAMIATDDMDMVFFFRDPLTAQPHEPDVTALVRLCDLYHIPLATNMGTAEILLKGLQEGFVDWRSLRDRRQ